MRIAFLTNILTPYRVSFYDELNADLEENGGTLKVFVMTDSLPLRPWTYEALKRDYTRLLSGTKVFIGDNDYLYNRNVINEVCQFNPDILIIAGSWTYPTFCIAVASKRIKRCCKRLLWTESHDFTGINSASKANSIVRRIKKHIFNKFDGYCVPGKYAYETISRYVDIKSKIVVNLPNLVDCKFYEKANEIRKNKKALRVRKGISENSFVFVSPARFVNLKGFVPFFENLGTSIEKKDVVFVLVGGGPEKSRIEKVCTDNKINVKLYDYQSQIEIREWLAAADAFLLPSLSDANPLSSIEAAWAGLPLCLSCYVGNGPELVKDGVNGVIFDPLDSVSVQKNTEYIINRNGEWMEKAREISYTIAKENFEIVKETKCLIKVLDRLVE